MGRIDLGDAKGRLIEALGCRPRPFALGRIGFTELIEPAMGAVNSVNPICSTQNGPASEEAGPRISCR